NTAANKGALLAFVAIAQTIPVLTSGLDLSVGMVFVMANCLASTLVVGTPVQSALGVLVVLASGLLCGALNGLIVVFGRLQPIIATLATGAIYYGVALWLRPAPGGAVNEGLADLLLTGLTYSGEANALLGGSYTLSSIAAVVVGGTSLYGGSGGAIGTIFGAFVLRTIGDLLFVFDLDPLWQPLFLGIVLLISVSLGSFRLLRVKKRVDLYR